MLLAISALLAGVSGHAVAGDATKVDGDWVRATTASGKEWPSYGLDYAESRFSRLTQINDTHAKNLGLLWSYDLESTRGVEATPLVVDGTMYLADAIRPK
jgi:quinohemoprotein ethanol dehydrogenase